LAEQHQV